MDAISQTPSSSAFSWMKMFEFRLKFQWSPKGPINNIPALVKIMAWRRSGDKPLSEPVMVRLRTQICITRPQWVNIWYLYTCRDCGNWLTSAIWYMSNKIISWSVSFNICTRFCCRVISSVLSVFIWLIYPYSSGYLHWYWGNRKIVPVPVKQFPVKQGSQGFESHELFMTITEIHWTNVVQYTNRCRRWHSKNKFMNEMDRKHTWSKIS